MTLLYKSFLICFSIFLSASAFSNKIDSALLIGNWKLHYYHLYTPLHKSRHMDTTIMTTGHVSFYKDHTYKTENMKMCFMDANDYICSQENSGFWSFTASDVLKITWANKNLNCKDGCPEVISRHGVYILKLTEDVLILRTEYYDKKRKERFVLDAHLIRKVE